MATGYIQELFLAGRMIELGELLDGFLAKPAAAEYDVVHAITLSLTLSRQGRGDL